MTVTLQEAADSKELEAAWRYIQADFKIVFAKRNRLREGKVRFWELMFSGGLEKLTAKTEAEMNRLHGMLKAIDSIRSVAREEDSLERLF